MSVIRLDGISDVVEINYVNSPEMYEPLPIGPDGNLAQIPGPLFYRAEVDRVWIATGDAGLAFEPATLGNLKNDWGKNASAAIGDAANPGLGVVVSNLDHVFFAASLLGDVFEHHDPRRKAAFFEY